MIQLNHIIQYTDTVFMRSRTEHKLPDETLADFAVQLNVNTCDGEDFWFDEETPVSHMSEISEDEFFQRYFTDEEITNG